MKAYHEARLLNAWQKHVFALEEKTRWASGPYPPSGPAEWSSDQWYDAALDFAEAYCRGLLAPAARVLDNAHEYVPQMLDAVGVPYEDRSENPAPPVAPYHGARDEKLIDSTSTHALWETPPEKSLPWFWWLVVGIVVWKYGSKKYWMITDHGGRMVDEHGTGFSRKRDALSAWSEYTGLL